MGARELHDRENADRHEANVQQFINELNKLLVDALKLSPDVAPTIFADAAKLRDKIRDLFRDNTFIAEERIRARARDAAYEALKRYY